jgi:8-oxo-dGTP diphosphatase
MEKNYTKIGVNVFIIKDNKLLFGKRIGKIGYGTWCLPGGHLEYGESLIGGAKRELEEETSIKADNLDLVCIVNDPLETTHYIHISFLAKSWCGEPKVTEPDKFAEWKWFNLNDLPENIFIGHQKIIPAFINNIKFID